MLHTGNRVEEALVEWRAAAALGHGAAMQNVGVMHRDGLGVARNAAEAHE